MKSYMSAWCLVEFIPRPGTGDRFMVSVETFPFISSVQATKNLGMVTEITISFDMPFTEGQRLLNNQLAPGILFAGTIVRVRMGYGASANGSAAFRQSEDFVGFLQDGGLGLQLTPSGLSGSVTATGISPLAARSAPFRGESVQIEFDRRLRLAGFSDPGYLIDVTAQGAFDELMNLKPEQIPFGSGINQHMAFIDQVLAFRGLSWTIATSVSGDDVVMQLYVRLAQQANSNTPFRFVMRGGFEYDLQGYPLSYPITSFQPSQSAALFYAGAQPEEVSQYIADIDRDGAMIVTSAGPSDTELSPASDTGPLVDNSVGEQQDGVVTSRALNEAEGETGPLVQSTNAESPNLVEDAFADIRQQATRFVSGLECSLVTFGVPHIRTDVEVIVQNIGAIYDGVYRVMGVTLSWTGAEIETTLTIHSVRADTGLPAEQANLDPTLATDYSAGSV